MLTTTYNDFRENIQIQNKSGKSAITNVFNTKGIGSSIQKILIKKLGINKRLPYSYSLNKNQNKNINNVLDLCLINDPLTQQFKDYILFYKTMKNYRGFRHNYNYPVRGQRTHTNGKTRKKFRKKYSSSSFASKKN